MPGIMEFNEAVNSYRAFLGEGISPTQSSLRVETTVECMKDWSPLHSLEEVKAIFEKMRASATMTISDIPLLQCRQWSLDKETGFLQHESGDFFFLQGLRVEDTGRERGSSWDQPMMTQVGYDGGILGLLRQRINGIPMYLVEGKSEPGNYRIVQLSPTLQATFANLRCAHNGRKPFFSELFEEPRAHGCIVHYDQWLSEDGGRLTNKRNKGMLIEAPADMEISLPKNFLWLSLWQIKELLHESAWINPHIRGIIAHL
jgi:oxidase EvaA